MSELFQARILPFPWGSIERIIKKFICDRDWLRLHWQELVKTANKLEIKSCFDGIDLNINDPFVFFVYLNQCENRGKG